eukprot:m.29094 g.29094  ORF g.29094 m.29094 type:complete len:749 (-) comp4626_c0_seq1:105-2351(-)
MSAPAAYSVALEPHPSDHKSLKALQEYERRGSATRHGEFYEEIEALRKMPSRSSNAAFIIASAAAGVGKTQAAFGLSGSVIYLHLSMIDVLSQHIYQSVSDLSNLFLNCLQKDVQFHHCTKDVTNVHDMEFTYGPKGLYSASLLWEICTRMKAHTWDGAASFIRAMNELSSVTLKPMTLAQCLDSELVPKDLVVVLDEVPPLYPSIPLEEDDIQPSVLISFARSFFLCVHAVTVMMGTDSVVSNMLTPSVVSASSESQALWATVVTNFPRCDISVLDQEAFLKLKANLNPHLVAFLDQQLCLCRPRVVEMLLAFFREGRCNPQDESAKILDDIVSYIGKQIWRQSGWRIGSVHGLVAQICMISTGPLTQHQIERILGAAGGQESPPAQEAASAAAARASAGASLGNNSILTGVAPRLCVSSYFAFNNLVLDHCGNKIYLQNDQAGVRNALGDPWIPSFGFPFGETLLCMALTSRQSGGPCLRSRFRSGDVSFRRALDEVRSQTCLSVGNLDTKTITGELLEASSFAAAGLASHYSVCPEKVSRFIARFCWEFDCPVEIDRLTSLIAQLLPSSATPWTIPYLFYELTQPEWTALGNLGLKPELYFRAKNADRVAGGGAPQVKRARGQTRLSGTLCAGSIVIEDKERSRDISPHTMGGILMRLYEEHPEAALFFIMCSTFSDDHSKTWESAVGELPESALIWVYESAAIHIHCGTGTVTRPMGLESTSSKERNANRTIVFVEAPFLYTDA